MLSLESVTNVYVEIAMDLWQAHVERNRGIPFLSWISDRNSFENGFEAL